MFVALFLYVLIKKKNIKNEDVLLLFYINYIMHFMRAAPKVMPPILICFPTTSEMDVGGMAVEVQPSHRCSITCCCHVTDDSWEEVWQNGAWHGCVYEPKVWNWISACGKTPLTFTNACWTFMETKQNVSTVRQWVVHFSSNSSYSGSSLLMEVFMSVAFKFLFITDKTFLL